MRIIEELNDAGLKQAIDEIDVAASSGNYKCVTIHNVVSTGAFSKTLDLKQIARKFYGEYYSKKFAAVQIRIANPKTTALIFATGKIVCTGAKSEVSSRIAMFAYYRMLTRIDPTIRLLYHKIENIVSVGKLHCKLSIAQLSSAASNKTAYDPEIFPGLRLAIDSPVVKVLLFIRGKCVITGAKTRSDISRAWCTALKVSKPFLVANTSTCQSHADIVQDYQIKKNSA